MNSKRARLFMRLGGFSTGVLVVLFLYPPWRNITAVHVMSDSLLAASAGFVGVIAAEIARKFIPGQGGLDSEEEHLLTAVEIAKLMASQRFVRLGALIFGFTLPLLIYPLREFLSNPLFGAALSIYWAFQMWVFGEIFLSIDPKQRTLTRMLRKRKQ